MSAAQIDPLVLNNKQYLAYCVYFPILSYCDRTGKRVDYVCAVGCPDDDEIDEFDREAIPDTNPVAIG